MMFQCRWRALSMIELVLSFRFYVLSRLVLPRLRPDGGS
jgi:hypothetical protein